MRSLVALLFSVAVVFADPVTDAADKALEIFRAKGDLKELAAKDDPDPWLVADELCARGEHDAAEAFAQAAPRKDTEQLAAYVATQRGRPADAAARAALATANAALAARDPSVALAAVDAARGDAATVAGVLLCHARGIALDDLRRFEESAAALLGAASAAERLGWLARAARLLGEGGHCEFRRSDWAAARGAWDRKLRLDEARGDRAGVAWALAWIGNAYFQRGEYANALECLKRALKLAEELGDRASAARTLIDVGNIHYVRVEYGNALGCYERALNTLQELGDRAGAARALGNLGLVHKSLGDYQKALECQERAMRAHEESGDRLSAAKALVNIGNVHRRLGEYGQSLECQERALKTLEELGDRAEVATALVNIGDVHRARGEYGKALEFLERALKAKEGLGDRAGAALALGGIGKVHLARGDCGRALEFLERALKAKESLGDRAGAADLLGDVGGVYYLVGVYGRALECAERALREKHELGDRAGAAMTLGNLGMMHESLGAYGKALECQERALKIREELGDRAGAAVTLANMGQIHYSLGEYRKALACQERALKAVGEDPAAAAATLGALGNTYWSLGEHANARDCLERALRGGRQRGDAGTHSYAARLGRLLLDGFGCPAEAVPLLEEAIVAIEAHRSEARGLGEEMQATFFETLRIEGAFEGMARAQIALGRPSEALAYLERGRARELLDLLARSRVDPLEEAERRARTRGDEKMLKKITKLKAELASADRDVCRLTQALSAKETLPKGDPAEIQATKAELDATRRARGEVLVERARAVRDLLPPGAAAATAAIQRMLGPKERLLFYAAGEAHSLLLVVPPAGGEVRAYDLAWPDGKPVTERSLGDAIGAYVDSLGRSGGGARGVAQPAPTESGTAADPGARLHDALVPMALREELKGLGLVYLVPHGPLHRLPFETLPAGGGARWLDRYPPIAYGHSGSVLLWCRERREAQRGGPWRYEAVALGDPAFARGGALVPLPGTRREVEAIRAALGEVATLLGEGATKSQLFALAPQGRYVHLATHQIADERAQRGYSRLALAVPQLETPEDGGFLSLYELFEEWRDRLSGCELVVLSACETVKGPLQRDEGPYAMPLGFLYAGAPAVIGSLWRVDDASTAELFADFYGRLKDGKPKLQAFTEARKALKKKHPEPYFWAPFVYVGDPR